MFSKLANNQSINATSDARLLNDCQKCMTKLLPPVNGLSKWTIKIL